MIEMEDRIVRLKSEIKELERIRFSETTLAAELLLGEAIQEKREDLRQLELALINRRILQSR